MSADLIQQAAKCLQVRGIFLRECALEQKPDYDPRLFQGELSVQFRVGAEESQLIEITDEISKEKSKLFKAIIGTGLRLIDSSNVTEGNIETGIVATLSAKFSAEYLVRDGSVISHEAQQEFAQKNAVYHVWPYYREFVQSTLARSGIPLVEVPMFMLAPNNKGVDQERPEELKQQ
jgi:hypothetical protein